VPASSLSAAESRHRAEWQRQRRRSHREAESWPWNKQKAPEATADTAAGTGVALAKPVALRAHKKKATVKYPIRPGCWMRNPSGCPNDPMDTQKWRHDAWAEAEGLDEAGCLQRVNIWKGYCGSGDVMMAFVANETRSEPFSALQISAVHHSWPWTRKRTPQAPETAEHAALAADKTPPPQAPETALVADNEGTVKVPTRPGCWMRMPSGCPKKPMKTQQWRRDTWAEQQGLDQAGCQQRAAMWNGYCEAQDAVMAFVADATPSSVQLNSDPIWSRSAWSDQASGAGPPRETSSEQAEPPRETRSEKWQSDPWSRGAWSDPTPGGEPPLGALQVSAAESWPWSRRKAPEAPEKAEQVALAADRAGAANSTVPRVLEGRPGCWMRMPSGCPKKPMNTSQWRRDAWAEQQGLDQTGCQQRAAMWNKLCDSQDAVMAFVAREAIPEALVASETPLGAFGISAADENLSEAPAANGTPSEAFVANETSSEAFVANETSSEALEREQMEAFVANETPSEAFADNETNSEQWLSDPWSRAAWSDPAPGADAKMSALQVSATESWPWSKKQAPERAEQVALAAGDAAESERAPSSPGCWFRMPTDCRGRNQGMSEWMLSEDAVHRTAQSQLWNHDTWAEQQGVDEAGCQARAAVWNSFCYSQDAVMVFVADQSFPPFVPA
jgi:hypothetical protein